VGWGHRRNQLCTIFWKSVWGFQSWKTLKNGISHWNRSSPLQQCCATAQTVISNFFWLCCWFLVLSLLRMHNICIIYNYNYKSTWNDLYIDDGARKFQRWRYYRPTWPHLEGPSRLKLTYSTRLAGLALPVVITGRLQTNCRVIMSSGIVRQGIQRCHPVLCAVWTLLEPVSPTIFEIMGHKHIGVMWRHRSRDKCLNWAGAPLVAERRSGSFLEAWAALWDF